MTSNVEVDAQILPDLIEQIPEDEVLVFVHDDGTYDTKACYAAIAKRNAATIIPTKKTSNRGKKISQMQARNETVRATKYLGRRRWKNGSGYHRRSLAETNMRCFKLLGERVIDRDFDRQVAKLQMRVAILNRFTQLGTPVTVRVA